MRVLCTDAVANGSIDATNVGMRVAAGTQFFVTRLVPLFENFGPRPRNGREVPRAREINMHLLGLLGEENSNYSDKRGTVAFGGKQSRVLE